MGMYKKAKNSADKYSSTTFNIFLAQYINTALLVLLAQNSFLWSEEQRSSYDKTLFLVGVFDEFNANWYVRIGTALFIA
jgi:hypothetical protein